MSKKNGCFVHIFLICNMTRSPLRTIKLQEVSGLYNFVFRYWLTENGFAGPKTDFQKSPLSWLCLSIGCLAASGTKTSKLDSLSCLVILLWNSWGRLMASLARNHSDAYEEWASGPVCHYPSDNWQRFRQRKRLNSLWISLLRKAYTKGLTAELATKNKNLTSSLM